jgi:opacity protein-like surface antigen
MKPFLLGVAAVALLSASASAADLPMAPRAYPPPAPPPFTWTSCYAGLRAGGGLGQANLTDPTGAFAATTGYSSANLNTSGYMIGGQFGCDYQFAPSWVVGIEGAVTGGSIHAQTTIAQPSLGDSATYSATTDFLWSATARVGYAFDHWLLFAKGGVAGAGNNYSTSDSLQIYNFQGSENRYGWTAGVGLEWAFWDNWSARVEYNYYGFGTRTVTVTDSTLAMTSAPVNISQNIQTIMLGVNFHAYAGP